MKNFLSLCASILFTAILFTPTVNAQEGNGKGNSDDNNPASIERDDTPQQFERQDRLFIDKAQASSLFEVKSSQLALQRSASEEIKRFAQQMMDDHAKLNARIQHASMMTGQSGDIKLSGEKQAVLDLLETLSGSDFDKAYVDAQIAAHKEAVMLFQETATYGQSGAVQNIARENVGMLEHHLEMAQQLSNN